MIFSVSRLSCPPTPQSRDCSRANNQNNHGVIGNGSDNLVNTGNNNHFTITRKEVGEWTDDSSTKSPLLWINGPAGVGKSVIAKTIAGSNDQVIATFFFATSSDRSAATLFPTLAWQLARKIPETKQHIIASLKNNGSLLTSEIKEQFDHLIAQPLKKCTMTSTSLPVMVIDGNRD
ncbi:hypothetical protein JOM56_011180 [Amanita muscaria]